ncbi:hypothetical protein A4X13_0g7779 [Tilletia indica]|uniref:ATP-dependent DNA helicase n=1 Tax=Tilletia indica TaxID=43049 RepID=A0A8T8SHE4_9BASI|nr:hypothetical protein A4X13_0g7779 [Tilletia indica]
MYNNALSFTSLGVSEQHLGASQTGIYTFKIQGALHHRIGGLRPADGEASKFAQIYFHETDSKAMAQRRLQFFNGGMDEDVLLKLQDILTQSNPYVQVLLAAKDRIPALISQGKDPELHILAPQNVAGSDPRRYNRPTADEVAVIMVGGEGAGAKASRDVTIAYQDDKLKRVSALHPAYLPLRYPLLIPYGYGGWRQHMALHRPEPRRVPTLEGAELNAAPLDERHVQDGRLHDNVLEGEGADDVESDNESSGSVGDRRRSHEVAISKQTKAVTQAAFYSYHIHDREGFSTILHGQRLFQEFMVDAWAQIEQSRLSWITANQQSLLRMSTHKAIQEANAADIDLNNVGTVVLPRTFVNGTRWWRNLYQDAMSIVRDRGRPDLFITFTANPHWTEIAQALGPGIQAQDRPDIVSRVFWAKLDDLEHQIRHEQAFGEAVAVVRTCEFQKRGMPHAHILVVLKEKLESPEQVDAIVSAEIPDPDTQPRLFKIVMRNMVHGPCQPHHPCQIKKRRDAGPGQCAAFFPRPYADKTILDDDGYPTYRRRNDGRQYFKDTDHKKAYPVTNQLIVPYSPYLSSRLEAHVNVEVCTSITAVKYLYKYVYKGPDRVSITLGPEGEEIEQVNEVKAYLDARYISASEAAARTLGLSLHQRYPAVEALPLHDEDEQTIIFDPKSATETSLDISPPASKLTAYFRACAAEPEIAGKLTYPKIVERYRWVQTAKQWVLRKLQRGTIGRVAMAHNMNSSRYYMRLLLHIKAGVTSFSDLKTVDGKEYSTYQEACSAAGLLKDDKEWTTCLEEASSYRTAFSLRRLFCAILVNNQVSKPQKLYITFKAALSEDCAYLLKTKGVKGRITNVRSESYARALLAETLSQMSSTVSLASQGIPEPDSAFALDHALQTHLTAEVCAFDAEECEKQWESARRSFNPDQLRAFESVTSSCSRQDGAIYFLDGPGGTGKTFVENAILSKIRADGQIALAVASSGIAALLLEGGRTAHSRFNIPIPLDSDSTCAISKDSSLALLLRNATLIVWDECPMAHRFAVEAVDRTLRDIRGVDKPFGGIVVLFSGDWRQTLPVTPKAGPGQIVASCLHNAPFWAEVRLLRLKQNQRLLLNADSMSPSERQIRLDYAQMLLQIGSGKTCNEANEVELPTELFVDPPTMTGLIQAIYPDLASVAFQSPSSKIAYFRQRSILFSRNKEVNHCNDVILEGFPGEEIVLLSSDEAVTDSGEHDAMYSVEYLNLVDLPGIPPHRLVLKEGVPIMLLRNLDPKIGLCNGTRLVVISASRFLVRARIMSGDERFCGNEVFLPRIGIRSNEGVLPFRLVRRQFPVRLAFAMTINKAQGQSVPHVGIDLTHPVFSHGQLYVALSRASDPKNVKVLCPPEHTHTPNIVFHNAIPAICKES